MRTYALTTLRDIVDAALGPIEAEVDLALGGQGAAAVKVADVATVYGGNPIAVSGTDGIDFTWVPGLYPGDD